MHQLLNGGAPPSDLADLPFTQTLVQVGKYLRWVMVSALPDVYKECKESRPHPDRSTFFFAWSAVESHILECWSRFAMTFKPSHLSLHNDGMRLCATLPSTLDEFCKDSVSQIERQTGFKVAIREKKHLFFEDMLRARAGCGVQLEGVPDGLRSGGNCIVLALWSLLGGEEFSHQQFVDMSIEANVQAQQRKHRTYFAVAQSAELDLHGRVGIDLGKDGEYLLHTEPQGIPHCVGVKIHGNGKNATVYDAGYKYDLLSASFMDHLHSAMDAFAFVTFTLQAPTEVYDISYAQSATTHLLQLMAGASSSSQGSNSVVHEFPSRQRPLLPMDSDDEAADPLIDNAAPLGGDIEVRAGDQLLQMLALEAEAAINSLAAGDVHVVGRGSDGARRCPLCPHQHFPCRRKERLVAHLSGYHNAAHQYCASGKKQLKVCIALYDADMLHGGAPGSYLQRSADLLRESLAPGGVPNVNSIDA